MLSEEEIDDIKIFWKKMYFVFGDDYHAFLLNDGYWKAWSIDYLYNEELIN